jgi:hypothetical protein
MQKNGSLECFKSIPIDQTAIIWSLKLSDQLGASYRGKGRRAEARDALLSLLSGFLAFGEPRQALKAISCVGTSAQKTI